MHSGKKKHKLGSDKHRVCLVCGNSTWREVEVITEPKRDHHFWISDTTQNMLKERCAKYGTIDSGLQALMENYDMFMAWKEKQTLRELVQINTANPIIQAGENTYVPTTNSSSGITSSD